MRIVRSLLVVIAIGQSFACDASVESPPAPTAVEPEETIEAAPALTPTRASSKTAPAPPPSAPAPIEFDPATATAAKVRIVALHRDSSWVACGVIHSTGAIEVEVLEVGEPAPRMILIISCPVDFGHRQLLEVGAILQVKLFARRQYWPTPAAARKLPAELPRRYVESMIPVEPALVGPKSPVPGDLPQTR